MMHDLIAKRREAVEDHLIRGVPHASALRALCEDYLQRTAATPPPPITLTIEEAAQQEVLNELCSARARFGPMHSAHEGYSVLAEEADELWEAVRMKQSNPLRVEQMRKEAIQVAAMAMRFVIDVCDGGRHG